MLNPAFPHRAWYDDEGNIILPNFARAPEPEPPQQVTSKPSPDIEWIIIEDDAQAFQKLEAAAQASPSPLHTHMVAVRQFTRETVNEGARQYRVSISSGKPLLQAATDDLVRVWRVIWNFLAQPVWVPTRRKEIKQYSRGTLFVLDILRFGGTFAVIFLGLFLVLNYDSFWQITRSNVTQILRSPTIESAEDAIDQTMIETLKQTAAQSQDGRERGELLSFLPTVGPPDNRILIPRLSLNVPLVTPPVASLLQQDWVQVETDIQNALTEGVVHYPGTARPGQAGNFFVTGHSSYYPWAPGKYKTVFARLPQLKEGDEYWVYYKGDRHRYIVTSKKEVSPSDVSVLDQPENKRISTLMTCTPVGTTLRRLVVQAQEIDPLTGVPLKIGERSEKGVIPKLKLEALPI